MVETNLEVRSVHLVLFLSDISSPLISVLTFARQLAFGVEFPYPEDKLKVISQMLIMWRHRMKMDPEVEAPEWDPESVIGGAIIELANIMSVSMSVL